MVNRRLTIWIGGREVLPVRAICYVVGWLRLTPDVVARHFARDHTLGRNWTLTAYYLSGNTPIEVRAREWDMIVIRLNALEAELHQKFAGRDTGYAAWLSRAAAILPARRFVWWDEFQLAVHADREGVLFLKERPGDAELIYEPMVDAETRGMVMEGFEDEKDTPLIGQDSSSAGAVEQSASDEPYDITTERGCRRRILENWPTIKLLHGDKADGRQVLHVLKRTMGSDERPPSLKTVQNKLIELRKEKLIPGFAPHTFSSVDLSADVHVSLICSLEVPRKFPFSRLRLEGTIFP